MNVRNGLLWLLVVSAIAGCSRSSPRSKVEALQIQQAEAAEYERLQGERVKAEVMMQLELEKIDATIERINSLETVKELLEMRNKLEESWLPIFEKWDQKIETQRQRLVKAKAARDAWD